MIFYFRIIWIKLKQFLLNIVYAKSKKIILLLIQDVLKDWKTQMSCHSKTDVTRGFEKKKTL